MSTQRGGSGSAGGGSARSGSRSASRGTAGSSRARSKAQRQQRSAVEGEVAGEAASRSPRTGAKRAVADVIRQIPNYLRLLGGLVTDPRVNSVDKLLVAGAIAYIVAPIDLIPDFIPFLGEVDDVFLLMTSLQRLIGNAGRRVVTEHWRGDPRDLSMENLQRVITAAAFFLPRRVRRRLRMLGRR